MIASVLAWSARHRWLVIVAALLFTAAGTLTRRVLTQDVVPEVADPQIALVATWMGHRAEEVESAVTRVLTRALVGIPGSTTVRAESMTGMAYVDVVFDSPSKLESGRRMIVERIAHAVSALSPNVRVEVGPAVSSTSWIFQYALYDRLERVSQKDLRRLQDEVLRPALAAVPGIAEVASVGGEGQQIDIVVGTRAIRSRALAFSDVVSALRQELGTAPPSTLDALRNLKVAPAGIEGQAGLLGELATVQLDEEMPSGIADLNGSWAPVGGIVLAQPKADVLAVVEAVKQTLARQRANLPKTVQLAMVYDRSDLIARTHGALLRSLAEEVAAAALVILLFLLHGRAALIPVLTLPVALLLTFAGMWILSVPANIMSLGGIAIALGLAVDAEVVALEACHRRMETLSANVDGEQRRLALVSAASTFAPAILTSLAITAFAFMPVLTFTGETGRLLRPLALTKTLVIAAVGLVTLTLGPALRDLLLRGRVIPESENPLSRTLTRLYRPFVHFALDRPALTLLTAGLALASTLPIIHQLGGEFLPRVDEGDLLFMPTTLPGVLPQESGGQLRKQDRAIHGFEEVSSVFGKVGRADTATDPAPFSMAETTIRLRPQSEWPRAPRTRWYSPWAPRGIRHVLGWLWPEQEVETKTELVAALDAATRRPGWTGAWTAPARARMDMMSTGIRTPVGIRIVSEETPRLDALGAALRNLAARVPGARSATFEALGGEMRLNFLPDRNALALYGVDPQMVSATTSLLLSGGQVGEIMYDGKRTRVRIASDPVDSRGPADQLREVTVRAGPAARGQPVPLALLGRPFFAPDPAAVRTEGDERCAYVYVDLDDGADPVGYVRRAQREVARAVDGGTLHFDRGERIQWIGQYPLFAAGASRLRYVAALAAVSMLGLLAWQFRNIAEALIVVASVPFALVGSIWTLFLLRYPLSAPVWIGLLSVAGLAMQTAVVMVVYMDDSFRQRLQDGKIRTRADIVAAHADGTVKRLRPKMMTVATMAAALLPLLWGQGPGADILRRVAAPMLGGLATSTFLTLEVLPVLHTLWRSAQLTKANRLGISLESLLGGRRRRATTSVWIASWLN